MSKRTFRATAVAAAETALGSFVGVALSACIGVAGAGSGSGSGGRDDEALGVAAVEATSATSVTAALEAASPADARRKGVACAGVAGGACSAGQRCCRTPVTGAAQCVAPGAACADARAKDWECASPAECATGAVCCARGGLTAVGAKLTVHHFHGTHCAAQCTAGEIVACAANADCAGVSCAATTACGMAISVCR